ncbi:uncharacterized protein LOC120218360 [Hibiscus syriacus]|uniref:uncharacterized protein LOC120218360 n=1 Tax=Hibiscus syriacus TaxID=106335 RepID=UPI0019217662|nr:uncharacterized protein LOC120218360 [Hibiscus syriacus]
MDVIFMPSTAEKSVSPNKQFKNNILRRYSSGAAFVSKQNENLSYNTSIIHGGGGESLLFAPPPSLSFSYNPSAPLLNPLFYQNYQKQLQPPLLPLPNKPLHSSLPSRTRSLSSSPSNVKNNKKRDPKRSKSKQLTPKPVEEPKKLQLKSPAEATKTKAVNKPFLMASAKDLEWASSSIFKLSPPPSSLPLPSFSLRPKLSCNAEAASADDDGVTNNRRRILRLP